jgi:hypothetical protein
VVGKKKHRSTFVRQKNRPSSAPPPLPPSPLHRSPTSAPARRDRRRAPAGLGAISAQDMVEFLRCGRHVRGGAPERRRGDGCAHAVEICRWQAGIVGPFLHGRSWPEIDGDSGGCEESVRGCVWSAATSWTLSSVYTPRALRRRLHHDWPGSSTPSPTFLLHLTTETLLSSPHHGDCRRRRRKVSGLAQAASTSRPSRCPCDKHVPLVRLLPGRSHLGAVLSAHDRTSPASRASPAWPTRETATLGPDWEQRSRGRCRWCSRSA